jgi:endonuclease III-like uncharacterized protein
MDSDSWMGTFGQYEISVLKIQDSKIRSCRVPTRVLQGNAIKLSRMLSLTVSELSALQTPKNFFRTKTFLLKKFHYICTDNFSILPDA